MTENPIQLYPQRLREVLGTYNWSLIVPLAEALREAIMKGHTVFLCGNGGSAANAIHLANDFIYGIAKNGGLPMKVEALPANSAVLTCLANDVGYSEVFAKQLEAKAVTGDVLVVLSGSGGSANVIRALEVGRDIGMGTYAILGFSGGRCKDLAGYSVHFKLDDMQICEDLQGIVGHMIMQWLNANPVVREG
jgi:D-sedoheptulose 7-phosphate isomerase